MINEVDGEIALIKEEIKNLNQKIFKMSQVNNKSLFMIYLKFRELKREMTIKQLKITYLTYENKLFIKHKM